MRLAITNGHLLAHRDEITRPKTHPVKRRHGRPHGLRRDRARR